MLHKKLPEPTTVSVVDAPAQMVDGDALTLMLGNGFTNTVTDALPEQPLLLVPVTE